MQDYKPNSHKYRDGQKENSGEKRVQKAIVQGTVRTKKKTGLTKFAEVFISDDIHNVKDYWIQDMLVPTLKKALITTLDMILNGGNQTVTGGRSGSGARKISYGRFYDDPRDDRRSNERPRTRLDFDDIGFPSRGEAEAVLDEMLNIIDRYKFVTVADMYDLAGLSEPFTSHKYGWTNLRDARVVRSGGEYILDLPKALPID